MLAGLFCLLPRSWAHAVGRRLGWWAYHLSARSRRVALENLRQRLGLEGADARRVAKASLKQAGASVVDMLRAPRMTRRVGRRDVEIPDATWRTLDSIRRAPTGTVLATCHLGNWEFMNLCGPYMALPETTVIVRPLPNPLLDRMMTTLRGWNGQRIVHRSAAAMDAMQRVRDGEVVAITVDVPVPPDVGAAPVDFLGLPTFTTVAAGYVAAMARARVYLAFLEPVAGHRYRFVLDGPLDAPPGATLRATAIATTERVAAALERRIRARPETWAWWMKRWRIRPDGATGDFPSYSCEESWLWPVGTKPRSDVKV